MANIVNIYKTHFYQHNKKKNEKIELTSLKKFENNDYFLIAPRITTEYVQADVIKIICNNTFVSICAVF